MDLEGFEGGLNHEGLEGRMLLALPQCVWMEENVVHVARLQGGGGRQLQGYLAHKKQRPPRTLQ